MSDTRKSDTLSGFNNLELNVYMRNSQQWCNFLSEVGVVIVSFWKDEIGDPDPVNSTVRSVKHKVFFNI